MKVLLIGLVIVSNVSIQNAVVLHCC